MGVSNELLERFALVGGARPSCIRQYHSTTAGKARIFFSLGDGALQIFCIEGVVFAEVTCDRDVKV